MRPYFAVHTSSRAGHGDKSTRRGCLNDLTRTLQIDFREREKTATCFRPSVGIERRASVQRNELFGASHHRIQVRFNVAAICTDDKRRASLVAALLGDSMGSVFCEKLRARERERQAFVGQRRRLRIDLSTAEKI